MIEGAQPIVGPGLIKHRDGARKLGVQQTGRESEARLATMPRPCARETSKIALFRHDAALHACRSGVQARRAHAALRSRTGCVTAGSQPKKARTFYTFQIVVHEHVVDAQKIIGKRIDVHERKRGLTLLSIHACGPLS